MGEQLDSIATICVKAQHEWHYDWSTVKHLIESDCEKCISNYNSKVRTGTKLSNSFCERKEMLHKHCIHLWPKNILQMHLWARCSPWSNDNVNVFLPISTTTEINHCGNWPTEYRAGCGHSTVLNNRNRRWHVSLAPASASVSASPRPVI